MTVTSAGSPGSPFPPRSRTSPTSPVGRLAEASALSEARFLPGAVVAERYRIVGLVGRGGMGEVYRADDLKLGQPVALKFLPERLAGDAAWLDRFLAEVRVARQVSHPNVCRVYDIGEVDRQHFFTMEYVDGEDLASLLRRIGRLPRDKAIDIARQLAVGLAAAHERGVLHRDLKPANVMIDGRGRVRLTDFGIASLEHDPGGGGGASGTPAYMAPEQLEGAPATVRTDLYALGLVLYETFTGKAAFDAPTLAELRRLKAESGPSSPSSVLAEIDPAVERVIVRCLDRDPALRPASALAVAAALPGGDPLAAALAAGETPSPDLVAAAGAEGRLKPWQAWSSFAALVAGTLFVALVGGRARLVERVPLEKPPDALAEKARQVLERTGNGDRKPAATALGFWQDEDVLQWLEKRDRSPSRWDLLSTGRLGAVSFWYRESPRSMVAWRNFGGAVRSDDPPILTVSGNKSVVFDERGRLIEMIVVPPQVPDAEGTAKDPDWTPLFEAAGIDPASFTRDEPRYVPPVWTDSRAAFKGNLPELPGLEMRAEMGAFRGRPDYFVLVGPWTRPGRMRPSEETRARRIVENFSVVLILAGLLGAGLLARKNLGSGRGDRRGASRMGLYVLVAYLVLWILRATHHSALQDEFESFLRGAGLALFVAAFVWLLYLALEPAVRRRWPTTLISWSRLIAFRFRDPLVGRDVLIGAVFGVGLLLFPCAEKWTSLALGFPPPRPWGSFMDALVSGRFAAAQAVGTQIGSALGPLLLLFLLVSLRALVRIDWIAVSLALILFVPLAGIGENPAIDVPFAFAVIALQIFVLMRLGLLPLIVSAFVAQLVSTMPVTLSPGVWWSGVSWTTIALVLVLGVWAVRTAVGAGPARRVERNDRAF